MKLQIKFDQSLPFSGTIIRFCRLLIEYLGRGIVSAVKHLATETIENASKFVDLHPYFVQNSNLGC